MDTLRHDLSYGVRRLFQTPGFTITAVLTLALGIGANSAIFSLVDGMFLRPLPIEDPDGLHRVEHHGTEGRTSAVSWADYVDLREENAAFSGLIAQSRRGALLNADGQAEMVLCTVVSDNYFSVLGVHVALGRTFGPELDRNLETEPAVVISHRLWQRRFGGDPELVGKTVQLNARDNTVVGIMHPSFRGLHRLVSTDVWVPTTAWVAMVAGSRAEIEKRDTRTFEIMGRLRPGISLDEAQAQLDTIAHRLRQAYPDTNQDTNFLVVQGASEGSSGQILLSYLLMSIVGLVLLIACVNVAGLTVAEAEARRREISIRLALGARRSRLVRQFLTESVLQALLGAALGLLLASWLMKLTPSLMPPSIVPIGPDVRVDGRVLTFTLATSFLTVMLIGLAPAFGALRQDSSALKMERASVGGDGRRFSFRKALVVGQVALSVVLLVAAGLLLRSFIHSQRLPLGFDVNKNMLVVYLTPAPSARGTGAALLYEELAESVESLPGVDHATYARRMPLSMSGGGATQEVTVPGVETAPGENRISIKYNEVAGDFFETMGIRILRGRSFDRRDHLDSMRVVLINETMALRYWPNEAPIGISLKVGKADCQIIGVVKDSKINAIHEPPEPFLYFPFAQMPSGEGTLIIETAGESARLAPLVRRQIRAQDAEVWIISLMTLGQHLQFALYEDRMPAVIGGSLGLLGILLAAVGLYGVVSYAAIRQTHEFGIRMAMGAERSSVLLLVLGQGLKLVLLGVPIGLVAAFSVTRLMSGLLHGVTPADPATFAASSIFVVTVALAASIIPARKATRVDPVITLRHA